MQLHHTKWNVSILLILALSCGCADNARAEAQPQGCAKNPAALVVPLIHVENEDRLKALIRLGSSYGVCLGVSTDTEIHPVSVNGSNLRLVDVIRGMFPSYYIDFGPSMVIIEKNRREHWLSYRLKKLSIGAANLSFNSMQIFIAMQYQLLPSDGGIMGSFPSSFNESMVGPITTYNRSIYQLLNEFVMKSTKGGAWFVRSPDIEKGDPPSDRPFWKVVPYGASERQLAAYLEQ